MSLRIRLLPIAISALTLFSLPAFAQNPSSQAQPQSPDANSIDTVANEIALLRGSLQTLNARLREISTKLPDSRQGNASSDKQNPILLNLDILGRAEQRAEFLRKQLLDMIEKEAALKSRLVQVEEDMRPENIERSMNLVGSTRTPELRETRRKVLENDRKGFESLLSQTSQSRQRLEDDVREADALVARIRRLVLPLIDKEIDKLNSN